MASTKDGIKSDVIDCCKIICWCGNTVPKTTFDNKRGDHYHANLAVTTKGEVIIEKNDHSGRYNFLFVTASCTLKIDNCFVLICDS
mmetsp:Transcript_27018/g.59427  ORF Transcript_27018/g.59427 Transcript_27018/m.59427 type:complete len:86 (+) Transcript_27018:2119-2376(+)